MGDAPTLDQFEDIFTNLISVLLALGGFALLIMIFIGGFKLLLSGGDPKAAETGKKTITYAIGGIVLLAGSFLILKLIVLIHLHQEAQNLDINYCMQFILQRKSKSQMRQIRFPIVISKRSKTIAFLIRTFVNLLFLAQIERSLFTYQRG